MENIFLYIIYIYYKKCTTNDVLKTNKDAARMAQNVNLEDRIEALSDFVTCFITIKDHKENFRV